MLREILEAERNQEKGRVQDLMEEILATVEAERADIVASGRGKAVLDELVSKLRGVCARAGKATPGDKAASSQAEMCVEPGVEGIQNARWRSWMPKFW